MRDSRHCNSQTRATDTAIRDGILLVGNGAEPATLDPNIATGVTENHIITSLIEGLYAYHPDNQALELPGMAESAEHNEDASVWTFRIRDAKWSNGDPLVGGAPSVIA